jgi:hypothetical protein
MEDVVDRLRDHSDAARIDAFRDRYLAFERVDQRLGGV